jgi:hypothetical protein
MRALVAFVAVTAAALATLGPASPRRGAPLWPGAACTAQERDHAVEDALLFIDRVARNPAVFADYGYDLIGAFFTISVSSADARLRTLAWRLGRRHAVEWRRLNPAVPAGAGPARVIELVLGADTAERYGLADPHFRARLREAAARHTAIDYYGWDPAIEPPPSDIPEECPRCNRQCARGVARCDRCNRALDFQSRYAVWTDALIYSYMGDRFGVTLGAHWVDVARWFPAMRPYPKAGEAADGVVYDAIYAVTHLIYTYNDYGLNRVSPACFPDEYAYLRDGLAAAIARHDAETVGEYLDTLRAFGLGFDDPGLSAAAAFVFSRRAGDGGFGDPHERDLYTRYHSAWTAIDGLREYRWGKTLPCLAP